MGKEHKLPCPHSILLSRNLHLFTNLEALQTQFVWIFLKALIHSCLPWPLPSFLASFLLISEGLYIFRASQVALVIKNPPANAETLEMWVPSLGWEDPLEMGMATHSSILAWRIPWTEPGGLRSIGLQRVRHDWSDLAHSTWIFKFFSLTSVGFTWAAYFKCKFLYSGP